MMDLKRTTIKIPKNTLIEIKSLAVEQETTQNNIINNLIDAGLSNTKEKANKLPINKRSSEKKELEIKNSENEIPEYLIGNKITYNPKKESWERLKNVKKATNGVGSVKALMDLRTGKG